MKPPIIMTHTIVAAAPRRRSSVRLARSTSSDVPAAPTPMPISTKPAIASAMPAARFDAIHAVASDATVPPMPSNAMPPTIQGVRRPPTSDP